MLERVFRRRPTPPPALPPHAYASAAIERGLPWQGNVADETPLRLVFLAASSRATGRLHLEGERSTYEVTFRQGVAVHVSSDDPRDHVAAFLAARGLARPGAVAALERTAAAPMADFVAHLAAECALEPVQAFRCVQEHALDVLGRALAIERGEGSWHPAADAPAGSFPICARAGVLIQAVRRFDAAAVRARLRGLESRATTLVRRDVLAQLDLSREEARAAALLDGERSIAELATAYPRAADLLRRVALLLAEIGLLSLGRERPPAQIASSPSQPRPTPVPRPAAATPPPRAAASTPAPIPIRPADPSPPPARAPAMEAEQLFARATALVKARQYASAAEALARAATLQPARPEYAIWRAWAEFLAAQNPKARLAPSRAAIEAALKRAPEYAPGYLFLARMAKFAGDCGEARKVLRRGLALNEDDADLQRELRYLTG